MRHEHRGHEKTRRGSAGFFKTDKDVSTALENAEYDGADKGEGDIGGYDAQLTDERTKGHGNPPKVISMIASLLRLIAPLLAITHKVAIGFTPKKSVVLSIQPISAAHNRCDVVKES
jgi:hypothetical protein